MHFEKDYTYHIYNRSNEILFKNEENYLFFLQKLRTHVVPFADIFAYCLMPNHFHLLITVKENAVEIVKESHRPFTQNLSKQIGLMLSSYTQAVNKKCNRKGSLFAHKTKAKKLNNFGDFRTINQNDYSLVCFNYIHQNPVNSYLVSKLSDWEYSSYKDYVGLRNGTLVNKKFAIEMLNLDISNFCRNTLKELNEVEIKQIF
jgi:REP element-mobilizing transposase RayT